MMILVSGDKFRARALARLAQESGMSYYVRLRTHQGTELTKHFASAFDRGCYLTGWGPYVTVLDLWEG